ncbi:type II toxin-antitoxin system RelE/ParE family toxin [Aquimarina sp. 2-A2]|uniref:type II toxin-antitoxin system RelE/ParE family toxin n=1 Tax=Aquimarina sp. 2-A2 TaxID=3382644 RepID=UPI00387F1A18
MARKVVWTSKAISIFHEILAFYVRRNQSKTYSRKLNKEINILIKQLVEFPYLGRVTNIPAVHVRIIKHYKIFYQITSSEIIIHLVWDTRQDPSKFPL